MKEYKARKGASFSNDEAQVIGETITKLRDKKGRVTAKKIVEYAKQNKSPLHDFFEWDVSKAAEKFRLYQARHLVQNIVEVVLIGESKEVQRSFFSVHVPNHGMVYVTLKDATENESYKKQLLSKIITTLENLTITMKMFREQD